MVESTLTRICTVTDAGGVRQAQARRSPGGCCRTYSVSPASSRTNCAATATRGGMVETTSWRTAGRLPRLPAQRRRRHGRHLARRVLPDRAVPGRQLAARDGRAAVGESMAQAPTAQAPAENPLDNAIEQLNAAADRLGIDEGMREVLRHCKREFTVNFPVQMDDGSHPRLHRLSRAPQRGARPREGRPPLQPQRLARRSARAGDVDDVEVRRRRPAVRRREGRRHRRPARR